MERLSETVLVYIEKDNQFLMLCRNKEEHDINKNKYVGVGGHLEEGETKEEALLREVKEETGLTLKSHKFFGIIYFSDDDYKEKMYLFTSNEFEGEIIECDEGTLSWVDKDKILDLPLWEGDKYFLKKIFDNEQNFTLYMNYSQGKLINYYFV